MLDVRSCVDCKHSDCRAEHGVTLRSYQQEALEKLQQPGNCILAAPTGVSDLLPLLLTQSPT